MSSLLDQAIIDAKTLKDAAMKNAENLVLEKYSEEVKEAIGSLLEQEELAPLEAALGAPSPEAPPVDSSFIDAVPHAHEDPDIKGPEEDEVIEIDFDDIRARLHAEEEAGELEASEMVDSEEVAEEIFGEEPAASALPATPEEELTISEELLKSVVEELTVDINPKADIPTGFAPLASADTQAHSEEVEAEIEAKAQESEEVSAEKEKYQELYESKIKGLNEETEELKSLLNEAKDHLNYLILENAKLVYQNKALNDYSLNERQKEKIVEAVFSAKTVEEAKSLYDTLQSAVGVPRERQTNSLREAVSRPTTSMLHSAKMSESSSTSDPHMTRMLRLAGIKN